MQRRKLLSTTGLGLLILSGCSMSAGTSSQLKGALIAAQLVDAGLQKIVGQIAGPPLNLISVSAAATVTNDLAIAETGIDALLNGTTPPAGASTLQQINGWFGFAIEVATPVLTSLVPGAAPIILALEAVDALLPIIEGAITAFNPTPAAAGARARVHAARLSDSRAAGWTPDQARAYLSAYVQAKV